MVFLRGVKDLLCSLNPFLAHFTCQVQVYWHRALPLISCYLHSTWLYSDGFFTIIVISSCWKGCHCQRRAWLWEKTIFVYSKEMSEKWVLEKLEQLKLSFCLSKTLLYFNWTRTLLKVKKLTCKAPPPH